MTPADGGDRRVTSDQIHGDFEHTQTHRRWRSYGAALLVHAAIIWGLALTIIVRLPEPPEHKRDPQLVVLAPRIVPPPPDVEKLGPLDVVTKQPRFRPRMPPMVRERRPGDPALAIWKYLCNRDSSLSEAAQVSCPFQFGDADLGLLDPLNRRGDVGAMFGADTTTMTLDEVGKAKGWARRKSPWQADGARAKGDDLGLPGHDPFAILPK